MRTFLIIIVVIIAAAAILYGAIQNFYNVKFVFYSTYDILVIDKKDPGLGYGIKFKNGLGLWKFGYDYKGNVKTDTVFSIKGPTMDKEAEDEKKSAPRSSCPFSN